MFNLIDFSVDDQKLCVGKNAEYTVEDLNHNYQDFIKYNADYKDAEVLELTDDKEENFNNLYHVLIGGNVQNYAKFPYTIIKSYINAGIEKEAVKYLKLVDNRIKSTQSVLADFLNDYILRDGDVEEKEELSKLNSSKKTSDFFLDIVAKRLKERFPKYMFVDLSNLDFRKTMRTELISALNRNGLEQIKKGTKMPDIFVNPDSNGVVSDIHHPFFIEAYRTLVDKYCIEFYRKYNTDATTLYRTDKDLLTAEWDLLKDITSEYESVLNEKEKKALKDYISKVAYLKDEIKFENIVTTSTRVGKFGELGEQILSAVNNIKNRRAQQEDFEVLNTFDDVLSKVKRVLSKTSRDEHGKVYNHRTDFFKVSDIKKPYNLYDCLDKYTKILKEEIMILKNKEKLGKLSEKDVDRLSYLKAKANGLEEVRSLVSKNFNWAWKGQSDFSQYYERAGGLNPENILLFVAKTTVESVTDRKTGRTVTKDDFSTCSKATLKYIRDHNLPEIPECAKTVFDSLLAGHSPLSPEFTNETEGVKKVITTEKVPVL